MASSNVLNAVCEKYDGFSFTPRPANCWLGETPSKIPAGTASNLPTLEVFDEGGDNRATGGKSYIAHTNLRFECFHSDLAALEVISLGLQFNGGAIDAGLGFHLTLSLPFDSTINLMAMYLLEDPRIEFQPDRSAGALRVYKLTQRYAVQFWRTGA